MANAYFAARARSAWARLIRKVYEGDPLECPKCKGPMRVIDLIEDPGVIQRILEFNADAVHDLPESRSRETKTGMSAPLAQHVDRRVWVGRRRWKCGSERGYERLA
mgnify:CR=1 FL=1